MREKKASKQERKKQTNKNAYLEEHVWGFLGPEANELSVLAKRFVVHPQHVDLLEFILVHQQYLRLRKSSGTR